MDFNNLLSSANLNAMDQANKNWQKTVNATTIQEGSTAASIAHQIHKAILKYQAMLPAGQDVALEVFHTQFNTCILIFVEKIDYIGYTIISFYGTDSKGAPIELIQNLNQLSFLLTSVPMMSGQNEKRKIKFHEE